jgi:iron complex outermembrane receptor protein
MDYANQAGPVTNFENLYGNRGISVENEYNGRLSNVGFFILDHVNLVPDQLELFLSGRFDRDVFSSEQYIPFGLTDTSRIFQKFAPKAGLNYKLLPSIALYASYGLSYDIPALRELINTPLSSNIKYTLNSDINAQQSNNFELGIKGDIVNAESEFMRKIFFEATFFHYVIRDEIIPFVINQQTYYRNAARTNRTGVEIGIKTKPFEGVEFTTNYTFTNFRYDNYVVEEFTPSGTLSKSYTDNVVPSVPKHILNFILNYEFDVSESLLGLLQWDCDYLSSMYVDDANSGTTPAYLYTNPMAGISYSWRQLHSTAFMGITNVFDRHYAGYINVNDYYGRYFEAGEPRSFYSGINISCQF